ncbi:glycosyltransferase family 1 protein [Clostridium perfringens]|uniref:glycosyltransferase n=1 Tax=Clostridium perfringens TaxID=1502 RepID=UPI0013E333D0|nr:glycosyltransferase [Clostridium perfringens]NGT64004.1 glycosyltransferase family 1 protein [Clostridium perfringens]
MKKIKIAHVVTRLEYGGVESVILNYVNNMEDKYRYDFHIITQDINADGCVKLFENNSFKVHITTHKRKSIYKNIREIYKILKKEKFDIVHCHMTLTNFYVLIMAIILRIKVRICHCHSAFIANSIRKKIYYKVLGKINILSSNVRIACGYNAGYFLYGKRMMENNDVYILNNAIDTKRFSFNNDVRKTLRKELKVNEKDFLIGHVGRFMEVKNHIFLLEILKDMVKENDNVKLIFVGDGELFNDIKKCSSEMGIEDYIIFVGAKNDTSPYYQAMDIFVLPSLYEGIPVVAMEAQCSGIPCVFSTNIDRSCGVLDNVNFMSLNQNKKLWINCINQYINSERNFFAKDILIEKGFDIKQEANKLSDLYKKWILK